MDRVAEANRSHAIEIRGVSKTFLKPGNTKGSWEEIKALHNIDLEVKDKEFFSFIGPSGCGKTTLLRMIDGLTSTTDGEILVNGRPVTGPGPDRGFVFQNFGLFPWRTVLQNVAFGLEVQGINKSERESRAMEYVRMVGLERFRNHYPHELSGGMQQRVGIARALAVEPDILLMDEPFGALDAQTREVLQEELLKIWLNHQRTIIFVTHSIDEAIFLSDRIALFSPGPGEIREILEVDFPHPRWEYNVRAEPRFAEMREHIWRFLKNNQHTLGQQSA